MLRIRAVGASVGIAALALCAPLTAAIAQLSDVHKYIPELPDYGTRLTVRQLMHHTSGLRDQWQLLNYAGWRFPDDLITEDDVLGIVVRQKRLNFKPGDEWNSNALPLQSSARDSAP